MQRAHAGYMDVHTKSQRVYKFTKSIEKQKVHRKYTSVYGLNLHIHKVHASVKHIRSKTGHVGTPHWQDNISHACFGSHTLVCHTISMKASRGIEPHLTLAAA